MFASLLVAVLTLPSAGAVDPAGDAPPPLEAVEAVVPPPPATAPPAPRANVVVMPIAALGVADDVVAAVRSALTAGLANDVVIIEGATLERDTQLTFDSCPSDECRYTMGVMGVSAVVLATVMPVADTLTMTIKTTTATSAAKHREVDEATSATALGTRAASDVLAVLRDVPPATAAATTPTTTAPAASTPKTSPPTATTPKASPPSSSSKGTGKTYDPLLMVLIDYALALVPVVSSPLFLPVVQAWVTETYGPELVGFAYPSAWMGALAGYATYAAGGLLTVGMYAGGIIVLVGSDQPAIGAVMVLGSAVVGIATFVAEPLIFHSVASMDAVESHPGDLRR